MTQAADLSAELARLRELHEAARLKLEIRQLQAAAGVHLVEDFGDIVDRREYLTDDPNFGFPLLNPFSVLSDRQEGKFWPIYQSEQDLARSPERETDRALGYHVIYDGTGLDWDYVPAARMEHFKRNVTANAKRGVSDFFPVLGDLEREAKIRRNTAEGAALQAAIAWIMEFPEGTLGRARASPSCRCKARKEWLNRKFPLWPIRR